MIQVAQRMFASVMSDYIDKKSASPRTTAGFNHAKIICS